jgi:D-amino-acid dehydrogenase
MVGVSTALALQERGRNVVLIDRREPGGETSFGNAGIIQTEAVLPYAIPLSFGRLSRIALGTAHDVAWSPRSMAAWIDPVARYFWHSLPAHYARIIPQYARLILRAADDHEPLIAASGSADLIRRSGFIQAYRSMRRFDAARREAETIRSDFGVPHAALDGPGLAAIEPDLRVSMSGAIHYTSPLSCTDPGVLVARYARLFVARGGQVQTAEIGGIEPRGGGWMVRTSAGALEAPEVVVALGPWSPKLLAPLGYRIPMVFKRGYHQHFRAAAMPNQPIMDVENSVVLSPMRAGLRVLTGAELNSVEGSANLRQMRHAGRVAKLLYPIVDEAGSRPWRGARPCMPDMLPVIGPASRHQGLWFNFGHGHQGFTLGPTSGAVLANAMAGIGDPSALKPYARY